jgi:hypothetical protein
LPSSGTRFSLTRFVALAAGCFGVQTGVSHFSEMG